MIYEFVFFRRRKIRRTRKTKRIRRTRRIRKTRRIKRTRKIKKKRKIIVKLWQDKVTIFLAKLVLCIIRLTSLKK